MAAGLGSSAAATVAGFRAFEAVTGPVPTAHSCRRRRALEGHCRTTPPLLCWWTNIGHRRRCPSAFTVRWCRLVLPWEYRTTCDSSWPRLQAGWRTSEGRAALTPSVSRQDAVFNLQRVLSLVHAAAASREYERCARRCAIGGISRRGRCSCRTWMRCWPIDDPADVLGACLLGGRTVGRRAGSSRFRASGTPAARHVRSSGIGRHGEDAGRASVIECGAGGDGLRPRENG